MKNIITVGGQGFLKECLRYLLEDKSINVKGYLGVDGFKPEVNSFDVQFLGYLDDYEIQENDYFVICVGDINMRKLYYERLKSKNAKFFNLIYDSNINPKYVQLGEANIFIRSFLTADIKVGNGNLFNIDVVIGHDVEIGDFNFVAPHTHFLGNSRLGSFNSIGTMSCLLPRAKVGDNNIIAPGSYMYKGCKNNGYYAGNPAIKLGDC